MVAKKDMELSGIKETLEQTESLKESKDETIKLYEKEIEAER